MYKHSSKRCGGVPSTPYSRKEGDFEWEGRKYETFGRLSILRETERAYLINFHLEGNSKKALWVPKSICDIRDEYVYIQKMWRRGKQEEDFIKILTLKETVSKVVNVVSHKE